MRSHRVLLNFVVETFSVCTDTIDQPCTEYDTPVHDLEGIPEPPGTIALLPDVCIVIQEYDCTAHTPVRNAGCDSTPVKLGGQRHATNMSA